MDTNKFLFIIAILLCGVTGYYSYQTSREVKELKEQAQITGQKVDSLLLATGTIAQKTKTVSSNSQPKSFLETLLSELEAEQKASAAQRKAEAAKAKITVSSS